ncbi:MAG: toluene tolerance protein [Candidatus Saccharibacteria bacterium]|nr:toluene tolerance protein [Moraxellaceae bacterium]
MNRLAKKNLKSHESDSTPANLKLAGDTLSIIGSVHFDNANTTYREGNKIISSITAPVINIDLSQLSQSHTVLLAVIIQWIRNLSAKQRIHLENVPTKMKAIIEASRLEEIL